jgi:hypothetical protein
VNDRVTVRWGRPGGTIGTAAFKQAVADGIARQAARTRDAAGRHENRTDDKAPDRITALERLQGLVRRLPDGDTRFHSLEQIQVALHGNTDAPWRPGEEQERVLALVGDVPPPPEEAVFNELVSAGIEDVARHQGSRYLKLHTEYKEAGRAATRLEGAQERALEAEEALVTTKDELEEVRATHARELKQLSDELTRVRNELEFSKSEGLEKETVNA